MRAHKTVPFQVHFTAYENIDDANCHAVRATDGEVTTMTPPLHYRIRPGALSVMLPASELSRR